MSHPHEDQSHEAPEGPLTLIIDETPMVSPGTDDQSHAFIKDLMNDLARHARLHPITLH